LAGYMLWVLRGVSLIASAITSLPIWRFFDPLPVLSRWEKAPLSDGMPGDDRTEDEKKLDEIFDAKKAPPDPKTRKGDR